MSEHRATLLVVEDDAATRTFLADNLTADGYEVLTADTGRHALHLIEHRAPAVAIVDVGLPDESGLDLVARVRAADGLATRIDPDLPILVVSGRANDIDRVRGLDRGADDYVCKPSLEVVAPAPLRPGARSRGSRRNTVLPSSSTR